MDLKTWLIAVDDIFTDYGISRTETGYWNWTGAFDSGETPAQAFERWNNEGCDGII